MERILARPQFARSHRTRLWGLAPNRGPSATRASGLLCTTVQELASHNTNYFFAGIRNEDRCKLAGRVARRRDYGLRSPGQAE